MAHCQHCGRPVKQPEESCPYCGNSPAAAGDRPTVFADGGDPVSSDGDADSETDAAPDAESADADEADAAGDETQAFSRRAMLGYGGGSALVTLTGVGSVWYAFFYPRYSPEETVVREYFRAIDRNKYNTADRLFHEDSPDSSWANDEIPNLLQVSVTVEDTEIRERWEDAERETVQEYALVAADVTIDNGQQAETFLIGIMVAKNSDDEWRIWRDESAEG
jgi:hypothetical protein